MGVYVPSGGGANPTAFNQNIGTAGNFGLVASTPLMLCASSPNPGIGTFLVTAQALVYSNTAFGQAALQIRTTGAVVLMTAEYYIPDSHNYTLDIQGIITNVAARPFQFYIVPDATLTGGGVSRYGTGFNGTTAPGTQMSIVQLA